MYTTLSAGNNYMYIDVYFGSCVTSLHPPCRHLRYLSQVEDKLRHTLSRSCIDVGCSDNVVQFLNEMGFR